MENEPFVSLSRKWRPRPRKKPNGLLYGTPEEALKALQADYFYWTQKVTEYSFSLSIALIGANWAVFGGAANKVMSNGWSKASLSFVISNLVLSLVGAYALGAWHGRRIDYAEEVPERWAGEYSTTLADRKNPWPYTQKMNRTMTFLKAARMWLPVIGGFFFLAGLFV